MIFYFTSHINGGPVCSVCLLDAGAKSIYQLKNESKEKFKAEFKFLTFSLRFRK